MTTRILRPAIAALIVAAFLLGSTARPARANTTSTLLITAAAVAALATAVNVSEKNAKAHQVVGYLQNGSVVYADGHVVAQNGQSWYPGNYGQNISCNGMQCIIVAGSVGYGGNPYGNPYGGNPYANPYGSNPYQSGYNNGSYPYGYNNGSSPYGYNSGSYPYGYNSGSYPYGYNSGSYPYGYNSGSYPYGYNSGSYPYGYNNGSYPPGYGPAYPGSGTQVFPTPVHRVNPVTGPHKIVTPVGIRPLRPIRIVQRPIRIVQRPIRIVRRPIRLAPQWKRFHGKSHRHPPALQH